MTALREVVLRERTGRVVVDRRPRGVAFSPDGRTAYVTAEVGGTLSIVDAGARRVTDTIPFGPGARPMGVVVKRWPTIWLKPSRCTSPC